MRWILVLVTSILVTATCGLPSGSPSSPSAGATGSAEPTSSGTPAFDLSGTAWRATSVVGQAVPAEHLPRLEFDPFGRPFGSGFTGCDEFGFEAAFGAGSVIVGDLTLNPSGCQGPGAQVEEPFLAALRATDAWHVDGDRLTLAGRGGLIELERELPPVGDPGRQLAEWLRVGDWKILRATGVVGLERLPPVRFADTLLLANGECGFSGEISFGSGGAITIGDLDWDATGCFGPNDGRPVLKELVEAATTGRPGPDATIVLSGPLGDVIFGRLPLSTLAPGSIATTVVDGLRVRSEPSVEDRSEKYSPVLPEETDLFVVDGPTVASGYEWWQVVPMAFADLQGADYGWVAAASRDGEPWIEVGDFECPPPPVDLTALVALSDGVALACFARRPITVRARLVSCNCHADGPGTRPGWLGLSDQPILLVDPSESGPPDPVEGWFELHLDPDAGIDPIPVNEVVDVTGIFDHPAAESCLVRDEESWSPSLSCRLAFAVTDLEVVELEAQP